MSDYHQQAEFLLTRGYVTGMTKDQLAEKLLQNAEKTPPENSHTRETVYDDQSQSFVAKVRDAASETQKRLIQPGERTSAALQVWTSDEWPLNQND